MESCLGDLRDNICIPYLDDVIIFSSSFKDHIDHLRRVLRRLREHGVKLKPMKCNLFKREVTFLGRIVSKDGYKLDPSTIDPVLNLKKTVPKTVGDVCKLVGLLSYYCHYIQDFSRIANPIYDLLFVRPDRNGVKQVKPKTRKDTKLAQIPSNVPVLWNDEHQSAMEYLIDCLTKPPIMAYPDFNSPFILHTDAYELGQCAVLYQCQNGKPRVIAYGLCTLMPAEKGYHLHSGKLEFLALKWAIFDHFRDYLHYTPTFTIYTDNNPLTYVLSSAKLNATGLCWVEELANFNFNIKYQPGKVRRDADTLSRMSLDIVSYMSMCTEETTQESLNAIISSMKLQDQGESIWLSALSSDQTLLDYNMKQ